MESRGRSPQRVSVNYSIEEPGSKSNLSRQTRRAKNSSVVAEVPNLVRGLASEKGHRILGRRYWVS
jgi:hypothetical protein